MAGLKGLFTGKRRREIKAELEIIERKLEEIEGQLAIIEQKRKLL